MSKVRHRKIEKKGKEKKIENEIEIGKENENETEKTDIKLITVKNGEILDKLTNETEIEKSKNKFKTIFNIFNDYGVPIILTIISFYLRYYKIEENNTVVWDEAHFAKFGSFYNKHTFYHDVHPPLGKMLCGLSEYLVGYKSSDYEFDSGSTYPDDIDYFGMRLFQVCFSCLLVPISWLTCRSLDMNLLSSYFISIMVCLESSFIVLGKFVLLDSFLFFFTATTFLCLSQVHKYRKKEDKSFVSSIWYILLGISIGCVCSVKWVGLFITAVVGVYTIIDLWVQFWDPNIRILTYIKHWIRRIISLIIIPITLYLLFFKIHFDLLYLPGEGSGSMNTIFQANMRNTDIVAQPRFVQLGDQITLRSQGPDSNLLHSHHQTYPDGSKQHQITTYGFKDANNIWKIANPRVEQKLNDYLKNNDVIRFSHVLTGANLHSHEIPGHVSKNFYEVSGYGDEEIGDQKDNWVVEIVSQLHSSNITYAELYEKDKHFTDYVHPVSTTFRLKHQILGCYLGTTGKSYPAWGFSQGEVVCLNAPELDSLSAFFNTAANWNIESIVETKSKPDTEYQYPKSNFFKDFIQIQRSMAASNNALTPDPSKSDSIASSWWEWPLMWSGIRMSGWQHNMRKYYMFGNPFVIWFTTLCLPIFVVAIAIILFKWQHQSLFLDENSLWKLFMTAFVPLLGYLFHYIPFIIMGRVTYFHHYMPALYFAIFMCGFTIDYFTSIVHINIRRSIYFILISTVIVMFILFSPTCLGLTGAAIEYRYINWLPTWKFSVYRPLKGNYKQFTQYFKKNYSSIISQLPFTA